MFKRFTDCDKWEDPWFSELSQEYKLFWLFILDRCDNSGVWKVNMKVANYFLGTNITVESAIEMLGDRIKVLCNGDKWWIKKFIFFQNGILSPDSKPHKSIINLLKNHSLYIEYTKGIDSNKVKVKVKDKVKVKEEEKKCEEIIKYWNTCQLPKCEKVKL
jgi:hypothetical protein